MNLSKIQENASYRKPASEARIQQRVCLGCDWWMRSAGVEHRICNHCKGDHRGFRGHRVGARIRPVKGFRTANVWTWEAGQFETVGGDL